MKRHGVFLINIKISISLGSKYKFRKTGIVFYLLNWQRLKKVIIGAVRVQGDGEYTFISSRPSISTGSTSVDPTNFQLKIYFFKFQKVPKSKT